MIKENGPTCVRGPGLGTVDYKSTSLVIEFGSSRRPGPFVIGGANRTTHLRRYAVNAIKLASPFRRSRIPDGGKQGIPILASFTISSSPR